MKNYTCTIVIMDTHTVVVKAASLEEAEIEAKRLVLRLDNELAPPDERDVQMVEIKPDDYDNDTAHLAAVFGVEEY